RRSNCIVSNPTAHAVGHLLALLRSSPKRRIATGVQHFSWMNPVAASAEKKTDGKIASPAYVALTGNPNCGKTTVFNALTGLRAQVGNYAAVTVERKEGRQRGTPSDGSSALLHRPV